jgi:DNA-binding response OmpR family regulator
VPDIPHVLLVEDNPGYAHLTQLMLEEGFAGAVRVSHVPTMGEALSVLADEAAARPDAVVVDLGLPDAEGTEVVVRLHAAGAPPLVVLSGLGTAGLAEASMDAGAVAYVLKGCEVDDLTTAVTTALQAR